MFVLFGGKGRFSEPSSVAGGRPVVVGLLAHVAIVTKKILAFLERQGGVGDPVTPGSNPGRRLKWVTMLKALDVHFSTQRDEERNGLRLLDGSNPGRAIVPEDDDGEASEGYMRAGGG